MNFEQTLFGTKTFSSLLKDIFDNSRKTEKQISELIVELKPYITSPGDAVILVPLIKEYLDVKVKNDEHLIKMAAIVQRAMTSSNDGSSDFILSEEEKEQLLNSANELNGNIKILPMVSSIPIELEKLEGNKNEQN